MPPSVGMAVGRYLIVERLGAGGMGEVFRAHDPDLKRDVAIKFLPDRFSSDPVRLARFASFVNTDEPDPSIARVSVRGQRIPVAVS